jgi:hypothetical protein
MAYTKDSNQAAILFSLLMRVTDEPQQVKVNLSCE